MAKFGLSVAHTKIKDGKITQVESEEGAPIVPKIGGKPDKKTQDKLLIDILAEINKPKSPSNKEE